MLITVIDVGGTAIKFALMNEQTEIIRRGQIPTPKSRENFISEIENIHRQFDDSSGIAMSLPGIIDTKNGVCVTSGALEFNNGFHIVETFQTVCNTKVTVENDAKCAALAEVSVGALADVNDGFVLIFGTAIGGAFIKDHKIHRGKHFCAGEVSFITANIDKAVNYGNAFGNLCGVPNLCKDFAIKKNLPVENVNGLTIFNAVEENDPVAIDCLNKFTRRIAVQIFNLQMLFDPERFAIGGGISAQPSFINHINQNIEKLRAECTYNFPKPDVVACKFRNDANLIGALQNFLA